MGNAEKALKLNKNPTFLNINLSFIREMNNVS